MCPKDNSPLIVCRCMFADHHPGDNGCVAQATHEVDTGRELVPMCRPCFALAYTGLEIVHALLLAAGEPVRT